MDKRWNLLIQNMSCTLRKMAQLPCSHSILLKKGAFLLATGTDAASENWAFVPEGANFTDALSSALPFFNDLKLPFIWPLLPGTPETCASLLASRGLPERGTLTAMSRFLNKEDAQSSVSSPLTFEYAQTLETASCWAEIAWQSFDSPPGAPESFVRLAQALSQDNSFLLAIAYRHGQPAGTFLLSLQGSTAGVYYFAVMPDLRRQGLAQAMMAKIKEYTVQKGFPVLTLQATPSGLPFYAREGFENLFNIPIHSSSPDIF